MARADDDLDSLRFSRRDSERLIAALLLSLFVHLGLWGVYLTGEKLGWWRKWHAQADLAAEAKKKNVPTPPAKVTPADNDPDMYVDVSQADADAPEKPKFYSNKNSHAANPDTANANVPKLNGRQTDMPKTEDTPKAAKRADETIAAAARELAKEIAKAEPTARPAPLQPSPPPPAPTETTTEKPEAPPAAGETELRKAEAKPDARPSPPDSPPPPQRPRTLKEALAQRDQIPGRQMQQAGGVPRRAIVPELDAKATPFGEYDRAIIEAVSQRWDDLLESHQYAQDRAGKVTLRFKLKPDGSIIEMQMLENTVGDLLGYLCQEAIEESAPFAKWPPDMVRKIAENYRDLTFTFYYESP
jgi:hypothetical protein